MTKFIFFIIFYLTFNACIGYADIKSPNAGEQSMIDTLRKAIDHDSELALRKIVIGAGNSGCMAFKIPTSHESINLLLTWQWLDAIKDLAPGTIVVMPAHAVNNDFTKIKDKVRLIEIQGVLHNRTVENVMQEKTDLIDNKTTIILMLAGDVEHPNGKWKYYSVSMANKLLKTLPQNKNILFLNGPRTGKHIEINGQMLLDDDAHKDKVDEITQAIINAAYDKSWKIADFKYGNPSLWGPALRFCLNNKDTVLILPGESTSMISETLGLGIRPAIYKHAAMTETSIKYVDSLIKSDNATLYPELPKFGSTTQKLIEPQQKIIIMKLKELLK